MTFRIHQSCSTAFFDVHYEYGVEEAFPGKGWGSSGLPVTLVATVFSGLDCLKLQLFTALRVAALWLARHGLPTMDWLTWSRDQHMLSRNLGMIFLTGAFLKACRWLEVPGLVAPLFCTVQCTFCHSCCMYYCTALHRGGLRPAKNAPNLWSCSAWSS